MINQSKNQMSLNSQVLRYDSLGNTCDTGGEAGGAARSARLIRQGLRRRRRGIREPRAPERVRGGETPVRPARQQPDQDVEPVGRQRREELPEPAGRPAALAERRTRARQQREARPRRHVLHPDRVEHPVELVHLRPPGEQRRAAGEELGHDAAERPRVDARVVVHGPQDQLRRAVPQRRHPGRVRRAAGTRVRRARQPEVADLDAAAAVEEDVVGLEVPVQEAARVHRGRALQEPPHHAARVGLRERPPLGAVVLLPHGLRQAPPGVLHDQERATGGVKVRGAEVDEAGVAAARLEAAQLAAERLVERVAVAVAGSNAEALDGDGLAGAAVAGLVDDPRRAFPDLAKPLVVLHGDRQPQSRRIGRVLGLLRFWCGERSGGGVERSLVVWCWSSFLRAF